MHSPPSDGGGANKAEETESDPDAELLAQSRSAGSPQPGHQTDPGSGDAEAGPPEPGLHSFRDVWHRNLGIQYVGEHKCPDRTRSHQQQNYLLRSKPQMCFFSFFFTKVDISTINERSKIHQIFKKSINNI